MDYNEADDYNDVDDWQKFGSLHSLPAKAGVKKENIGKLVGKELTDNALDACPKCIVGNLQNGFFYVQDYGGGIDGTDEEIASLFSFRRPMRSKKMWRLPKRGALGNGLRIVAGAVCATEGTLIVSTRGRTLKLTQWEEGMTQSENIGPWEGEGTRVEFSLPGLQGDHLEWAKKIIWISDGQDFDGFPSPWWHCSESFRELVRSSPKSRTLADFFGKFGVTVDDPKKDRKARQLAFKFPNKALKLFTNTECNELLSGLRKLAKPLKAQELLGYGSKLPAEKDYSYNEGIGTFNVEPAGGHYAQIPFAVQVWGKRTSGVPPSVKFFVNKTHTTRELSIKHVGTERRVTKPNGDIKVVKDDLYCLDGCGLDDLTVSRTKSPIDVIVNIITPYMPIVSESKEPDLKQMSDVIGKVIQEVAKEAKKNITLESGKGNKSDSQAKIVRDNIDNIIKKVSHNYSHRYNPRHLFYPMRDIVNEKLPGTILQWNNFEGILTVIEQERGADLPKIYRDLRGTLYHPHLKENIPVGTLNIEKYKRPEWTFNKLLYIEKEGFFEILKDLQWPERHDCALLTSKGFSTRAARDLIDLLGETGEEIQFFCAHDADAYGTMIYQTLVEATKARFRPKGKNT